jgi:hypothetical protein
MTRADTKDGRWFGSRAPFRILADFIATGDAQDLAIWREYEQASHGRHFLHWSPGLKAHFGIGERTDEEIAAERIGGTTVVVLAPSEWKQVVAAGAEWAVVAAAPDGLRAVDDVLAEIGVTRAAGYRARTAGRAGWRVVRPPADEPWPDQAQQRLVDVR